MNQTEPFVFYTERRLVALTGIRASNLEELLGGLRDVPGSSIFYHTHHTYLAHHFEKTPTFANDFARWTSDALQEERLAERLAAIDLLSYTSLRQLRESIISTIERTIPEDRRKRRHSPPGDEFHFCRSKSFIMPTGRVASAPDELFEVLPRVSNVSLFFHFFEARLRLERPTNDFSQWLSSQGEERIAKAIDALDPYSVSLDDLNRQIVKLGSGSSNGRGNGRGRLTK